MHSDEDPEYAEFDRAIEGLDGSGTDMSRILSLSDGIFAFALTFLVVTLVVPTAIQSGSHPTLDGYLSTLEPGLLGYFLAFFIISGWWSVHRRLLSPIVRYDQLLVRLNNLFLLEISITPFLVGILFAYGPSSGSTWAASFGPQTWSAREAVILYAVTQILAGLTLLGIWRHATAGHRLVRPSLPREWIAVTHSDELAVVGIFGISILVAFVSPLACELIWILMIMGRGRRLVLRPRPPRPKPKGALPMAPPRSE
jgi:uncharacterized membrane protein